jgi:putative IMPACT (imprinted ancient) family translation regulator
LIVRYFGGIKLGTGGMARAYASSVKSVLDIASLQSYEKLIEYSFKTSYSDIDKTMHKLKELGITKIDRDFGISDVEWKIKTTQDILSKVIID